MKMFFSAGVKFTASSVWGHRRPAVFILGHTCITGRASLALRATPDPAKPVPPWRKQKNRTVLRTEQREVTGTVLILMTLRHTVHLNTLPNTPTLTRCSGMISLSDSLSPVIGSIMSFLINFSTHSMVTTAPLKEETQCFTYSQTVRRRTGQMAHVCTHEGLSTAQGMLLARTSLVTAHTYLSWRQRTQLDRTELH